MIEDRAIGDANPRLAAPGESMDIEVSCHDRGTSEAASVRIFSGRATRPALLGWLRRTLSPADGRRRAPAPMGWALVAVLFAMSPALANAQVLDSFRAWPKEKKLIVTNLGIVTFIGAYGVANWDYFSRAPSATSEGWFGRYTKEGGADKIGHSWMTYTLSQGLSSLYQFWGFEQRQAGTYGALSALGIQMFMEVGDAFSKKFGFSYEDAVMNVAGAAAGYAMWRYPELRRKLDFRLEYRPKFDTADVFTDYENQKYLLAVKLGGFDAVPPGPLRYLELHFGYFARGYSDPDRANDKRNLYFGVGFNLSRLARKKGFKRTSTVLRFLQPPYTYLPIERDLNR